MAHLCKNHGEVMQKLLKYVWNLVCKFFKKKKVKPTNIDKKYDDILNSYKYLKQKSSFCTPKEFEDYRHKQQFYRTLKKSFVITQIKKGKIHRTRITQSYQAYLLKNQ